MKKMTKIGIVSGIAVAVALSTILSTTAMLGKDTETNNNNLPTALAEQLCLTKAQALAKTAIKFKQPTQLPAGYEFKCADADPYTASLLYWNQTITNASIDKNAMVQKGAISITVERRDAAVDPAYNVKDRTKEIEAMYNDLGPQYHARLTHIQGNLALVREQCETCGQQSAVFTNGEKIVNTYSLPTRIVYYDGDLWYIIEANLPSAELEKMAQSMA